MKILIGTFSLLAPLSRHYQNGETVAYQMHGVNQGQQRTIR
jgi:hypothetical protein